MDLYSNPYKTHYTTVVSMFSSISSFPGNCQNLVWASYRTTQSAERSCQQLSTGFRAEDLGFRAWDLRFGAKGAADLLFGACPVAKCVLNP